MPRGWQPQQLLLLGAHEAFQATVCFWPANEGGERDGSKEVSKKIANYFYLMAIGLMGDPTAFVTGNGGPQKKNS